MQVPPVMYLGRARPTLSPDKRGGDGEAPSSTGMTRAHDAAPVEGRSRARATPQRATLTYCDVHYM